MRLIVVKYIVFPKFLGHSKNTFRRSTMRGMIGIGIVWLMWFIQHQYFRQWLLVSFQKIPFCLIVGFKCILRGTITNHYISLVHLKLYRMLQHIFILYLCTAHQQLSIYGWILPNFIFLVNFVVMLRSSYFELLPEFGSQDLMLRSKNWFTCSSALNYWFRRGVRCSDSTCVHVEHVSKQFSPPSIKRMFFFSAYDNI